MTSIILIDPKKVFDTIDHAVLLQTLHAIGFSKHTVDWFKSQLSNLSFAVNLGKSFSQLVSVSCSVLQGSIFGPFLFIVFVSDMPQTVTVIFFSMSMIYILSFNIKISMKFKNS